MPLTWRSHTWLCLGTPDDTTVTALVTRLQNYLPLPHAGLLGEDASLEASAARALDLITSDRVPLLIQADDPVFLASSKGELCRTLKIICDWAFEYKASWHTGPNMTVCMVTG